ncbi:hypothetical protein ES703_78571 [subsurface metagenome]
MVSGAGEFVAPSEWVSPKCGTEGELCFKDENGSLGLTTYKFSPLHWCKPFIWPDYNPTEIDPGESKPVYVEGGVPPYTWSVSGEGFSLAKDVTEDLVNTLHASPSACGTALINVIDICGNETFGCVLCTNGFWALDENICVAAGPEQHECDFISAQYKWHIIWYDCKVDCNWSGACHAAYFSIPGFARCIPGYPNCYFDPPSNSMKRPICIVSIKRYIWECP